MVSTELRFPQHIELYRYWDAKRGQRSMPSRRDLDPGEIPTLLSHLMIVDKLEGQLRYRLVGTAVAAHFSRDPTGLFVGENVLPPEYAASLRNTYEQVWSGGQPLFTTTVHRSNSSQAIEVSARLLLPLGTDEQANVNMIIVSRVSRFAGPRVLKTSVLSDTVPGRILCRIEVAGIEDVLTLSAEWEENNFDVRAENEQLV